MAGTGKRIVLGVVGAIVFALLGLGVALALSMMSGSRDSQEVQETQTTAATATEENQASPDASWIDKYEEEENANKARAEQAREENSGTTFENMASSSSLSSSSYSGSDSTSGSGSAEDSDLPEDEEEEPIESGSVGDNEETDASSSTSSDTGSQNQSAGNTSESDTSSETSENEEDSGETDSATSTGGSITVGDTASIGSKAEAFLTALRTYDTETLGQHVEWVGTFSGIVDAQMMKKHPKDNLIRQAASSKWASTMSAYEGVKNVISNVEYTSVNQGSLEGDDCIVVEVTCTEKVNSDKPSKKSNAWRTPNVMASTYNVYFTPDGSSIFSVMQMDTHVVASGGSW